MQNVRKIERRSKFRRMYLAEIIYGTDTEIGRGRIWNLSLDGVFIATGSKVPVGTEILVTIPFAKAIRHVSLRGTVVRINGEGFAVSFRRWSAFSEEFKPMLM